MAEHAKKPESEATLPPARLTHSTPTLAPQSGETHTTATDANAVPEAFTPPIPQISGYEVLEVLGRGGMGIVYKARHVNLKRLVALKMIVGGEYAAPDQLARFQAEAEFSARLCHPNIVQIYEVGRYQGMPFLALEYVDGGSLSGRLQGQPQAPRAAAEMVHTLALAIHQAH